MVMKLAVFKAHSAGLEKGVAGAPHSRQTAVSTLG
jgi:hypothetical protein